VPILEYGDIKLYECPGKFVTDDTREILMMYSLCKKFNALPVQGGILDQSATFLAAIAIIEQVILEQEEGKDG